MFEEKTYENLMKEKMDNISPSLDKREGSLLHFACGANSAEAAQMYIVLEWMFRQMFGDTADREYLIKIAADTRGLAPKVATHAVLKGKFNMEMQEGIRFSLDSLNYCTSDFIEQKDGFFYYKVICETTGEVGNQNFGMMIPIDYVKGLTTCEIIEVLTPGEDEEDTEVFRQRWRNSFNSVAFGGNKADYMEKVNAIDGVGGCKVYRATNAAGEKAGGYVKVVIIASNFSVPTDVIVSNVQTIMDPKQDAEGDGLAPIGHICTIASVSGVTANVASHFVFDDGYSFADLEEYIKSAIREYLLSLAKNWADSKNLIVRISAIESRMLDIDGILDVADTTLNGVASNLTLGPDEIPVLGTVGELNG